MVADDLARQIFAEAKSVVEKQLTYRTPEAYRNACEAGIESIRDLLLENFGSTKQPSRYDDEIEAVVSAANRISRLSLVDKEVALNTAKEIWISLTRADLDERSLEVSR